MRDYHFHFLPIWQALPDILAALVTSVMVAATSIAFAIVIGLAAALAAAYGGRRWRAAVILYVEAMRNSPSLVKMFFIYFGLPSIGLYPDPFWSGVGALALHNGGYLTEIFRGGLAAVNPAQVQAARSLGFGSIDTQLSIVLPQAVRFALPAAGNVWIEMIKDTALTSAISVRELFYVLTALASSTLRSMELLIVFSAIYLALSTACAALVKALEMRTRWQ